MRNFQIYVDGATKSKVTCINDNFGKAFARFDSLFLPGEIAKRCVEHRKTARAAANFRIVRKVSMREVQALLVLAKCPREPKKGFWYEVIGD